MNPRISPLVKAMKNCVIVKGFTSVLDSSLNFISLAIAIFSIGKSIHEGNGHFVGAIEQTAIASRPFLACDNEFRNIVTPIPSVDGKIRKPEIIMLIK